MTIRVSGTGYDRGQHRQTGIALVLVLWVLALLTVMAMAMVAAIRSDQGLVRNRVEQARLHAVGEAAVLYAYLRVTNGPEEERWVPDGRPNRWTFGGMDLDVEVHDESSRIDLNKAADSLLGDLLEVAGFERGERERLVGNILAWRDADESRATGGAEDRDYRAAGAPYGAKDAFFDAVEELRQVLGVTPEQYRLLAPNLTVYGHGRPNDTELAPPLVRAALELKTQAAQPARGIRRFNPGGPYYRIRVRAAEGGGAAMEVLVKTGAVQGRPFSLVSRHLYWQGS